MTKAIWAALMAASSILPSVASAQAPQDRGDRPQLTGAQRQARADRRAERRRDDDPARGDQGRGDQGRGDRGGYDGGQQGRGDRSADQREQWRARHDDGRQQAGDRDGGRLADGRYDRHRANDRGGFDRDRNPGWDRRGGYDAPRFNAGSSQRWSNDWRRDGRYDWNRYRSYNRDAYRLPRYYAPGGWAYGYRRFSIGARIAAPLFGRNYWIADPWAYRLPSAHGPYRWVRYYDDAVLVDLRSGYVVDTVYGIFG